ncbi:MAG: chemotaxis protein [Nitrosopumilaceae archaeon]
MVTKAKKTTKKATTKKKTVKKAPTPAVLLKKVAGVSDTTKTLSKEIKAMTKIFSENQKVLVSMKSMIDSVSIALEHIQKQSRQINIIEEDNQKLFSSLSEVRGQAGIVSKINSQTERLQDQINKITKSSPDTQNLMQKVSDSFESIKNNSKMIMTISERIDNVREDLKRVSAKAESSGVEPEIGDIKKKIESISGKAEQIESLGGIITNLRHELESVVSKANSISGITGQLDELKQNIQSISNRTEEKISGLSSLLNRADASTSEFHKKTNQIIQEIQGIKSSSSKSSEHTSKEVVGLLKLSEYQSNLRMQAESKYGDLRDLEKMATQTAEMVNLFDRLSIESEEKFALPSEVRKWAVSKILDCADRWEIRFSDVYNILESQLGRDLLKESLRIQQVRDIFGIRAVDEIRQELNIVQ